MSEVLPHYTYYPRIKALFDKDNQFALDYKSVVGIAMIGSHSHGTYIPPTDPNAIDDVDFMGIVLPPPVYLVSGTCTWDHWTKQHEELDIVMYSLTKWVGLMLNGNPNVLGLLWIREQDMLHESQTFKVLRQHRHLFASKRAYKSFAGYAAGQLQSMTAYSPEIQAEIDTLTAQVTGAGWSVQDIMTGQSLPMPPAVYNVAELNVQAKRLKTLRAKYHQAYMGEKRRSLVVQHGYDTKNAAHLIRLLLMCKEFMETGEMQVYRTHDALMLKDIKQGVWSLVDVKAFAEFLFAQVKVARDRSPLPELPDTDRVGKLVTDLALDMWSEGRA